MHEMLSCRLDYIDNQFFSQVLELAHPLSSMSASHSWGLQMPQASKHSWEAEEMNVQHRPTNTSNVRMAQSWRPQNGLWRLCSRSGTYLPSAPRWSAPCLAGQRKAGLPANVPRLALRPGGRSGNCKRHLDICHWHAKGRQLHYLLPVPGHKSHDLTRTVHDVPTTPVLEVLAKELRDSATGPFKREDTRENGTLPRASWDHPVVKASSTPVLPVAVYMDKFAHSRTDSVLGVWAINVMSQEHHVVALVRKRQVGVPGMVFPVPPDDPASLVPEGRELCVEGISTCLVNFVRGPVLRNTFCKLGTQPRYPVCRHDGSHWERNDQQRASGARAHYKRLGRAQWISGLSHLDLQPRTPGLGSRRFPFHLNTHEDHKTDYDTCEIVVLVDSAAPRSLASCGCSPTTTRQAAATGGAFLEDIPELILSTDD